MNLTDDQATVLHLLRDTGNLDCAEILGLVPYAGRDTNRTGGGKARNVTRAPEDWAAPVGPLREAN